MTVEERLQNWITTLKHDIKVAGYLSKAGFAVCILVGAYLFVVFIQSSHSFKASETIDYIKGAFPILGSLISFSLSKIKDPAKDKLISLEIILSSLENAKPDEIEAMRKTIFNTIVSKIV